MLQQNFPNLSLLAIRVDGIFAGYTGWEQLSQKATRALQCSRIKECSCETHQRLRSMLLRLYEQAAALEDFLIERDQIIRTAILRGMDFPTMEAIIIIQRKDTEYSFARFSPGWFEMLRDFFHPQ